MSALLSSLLLTLGASQVAVDTPSAVPIERMKPRDRLQFDVKCAFRDVHSESVFEIELRQTGGVIPEEAKDREWKYVPPRTPTMVQFLRDDLGIFGEEEFSLAGRRYSDWFSDGAIELYARNGAGGIKVHKFVLPTAHFSSPSVIGATAEGYRYGAKTGDEGVTADQKFILVGTCKVAWKKQ